MQSLKNINRFKDIAFILAKYGFDEVLEKVNLPGSVVLKKITGKQREESTGKRLRFVLEELGPTFIKIGQFLSTRPDIFEEEIIRELVELQDKSSPFPFSVIKEVIEKELKANAADYFSRIDEKPMATASISQVHTAILRETGKKVVIKVQKPGIDEVVRADLEILEFFSGELEDSIDALKPYNIKGMVAEIKRNLNREMNFTTEAVNMRNFKLNLAGDERILVPEVYLTCSTPKILVMDYLEGVRTEEIRSDKELARELAAIGIKAVLKQTLVDGFFHADPHPGNILFTRNREIIFLDFGLVGRFSQAMKFHIANLLRAIAEQKSDDVVQSILEITPHQPGIDKNKLEIEVMEMLSPFYGSELENINMGDFLMNFLAVLRNNHLSIDPNYTFMLKSLITMESIARSLSPTINLIDEARPYLMQLYQEQYSVDEILKRTLLSNRNMLKVLRGVPSRLDVILRKLEADHFRMEFKHVGLEDLIRHGDRALNNLTLGIIAAACILGSSWIISSRIAPLIGEYSILGLLGYGIALFFISLILLRVLRR